MSAGAVPPPTLTLRGPTHSFATEPNRAYLVVVESLTSRLVELPAQGEVMIGRSVDCTVPLADPAASRQHARIICSDDRIELHDLGSHNGTRVNGVRLSAPHALQSGDVITLCSVSILFHAASTGLITRPVYDDLSALRARLEDELLRSVSHRYSVLVVALRFQDPQSVPQAAASARLGEILTSGAAAAWVGNQELVIVWPAPPGRDRREAARRLLASVISVAPQVQAGLASCPEDGYDVDALLGGARDAAARSERGQLATAEAAASVIQLSDLEILVADPAMQRLYALLERLSRSELPVLIHGETGTGKELVARFLHERSKRCERRLLSLNCAALPESLAESELFGHERGAFSGAVTSKAGLFESAAGGTLFLDEIAELPLSLQAKLLRVLETRQLMRVGDTKERTVDVRIVAATHRNLEEEVARGRFRQDLFFRLSSAVVALPPLRKRQRELPLLARSFLQKACARLPRDPLLISPAAMDRLLCYPWPGNVRELRNAMEYAATVAVDSVIGTEHLPERIQGDVEAVRAADHSALSQFARAVLRLDLPDKLAAMETALVEEAMALSGFNKTAAARLLGVHRKAIERRVSKMEGERSE